MRLRVAVLALLVVSACRSTSPATDAGVATLQPWPPFPLDAGARTALISGWTRRPTPPLELSPDRAFAVAEREGWNTLPVGDTAIATWLDAKLHAAPGRRAWLLFGTFHDAAGQLTAFRRLVGPSGVRFTDVVLEQLRADGRWTGLDAGQRGDSALLARAAWPELARAHDAHDYTAWKYGYAGDVLELLAAARGLGTEPHACDVPDDVLALLPNGTDDDALRVRELHCLLSLRDALANDARVAMLWGQAHALPDGFRRFLAPEDRVLALFAIGARHSDLAPDELLAERLVLNDPVLVPLGEDDAALLLPDQWLGGVVSRVRTTERTPPRGVRVLASTPGRFRLGTQSLDVDGGVVELPASAGLHAYVFASGALRIVGVVDVPSDGGVELTFDPAARATQLVLSTVDRAP